MKRARHSPPVRFSVYSEGRKRTVVVTKDHMSVPIAELQLLDGMEVLRDSTLSVILAKAFAKACGDGCFSYTLPVDEKGAPTDGP